MAEKRKSHEDKGVKDKSGVDERAFELPIDWKIGPEICSRYVNQAIVQYGPSECYVMFFEIRPPIVLGTQQEKEKQVKELKSVTAECVARIIVEKSFVPSLIKMLQETWDNAQRGLTEPSENKVSDENNGKKKVTES